MGSFLRALKRILEACDHLIYQKYVIKNNTMKTKITTEVIIAIVLVERIDDGTMTIFGAIVGIKDGIDVGTGRPLIV